MSTHSLAPVIFSDSPTALRLFSAARHSARPRGFRHAPERPPQSVVGHANSGTEPSRTSIASHSTQSLHESLQTQLQAAEDQLAARTGVRLSLSMQTRRMQREESAQSRRAETAPPPEQSTHRLTARRRLREQRRTTRTTTERQRSMEQLYHRTETLAWKLDERRAEGLRQTRNTLSLRFKVDIRINVSMLERFAEQSEALAEREDGTLDAYLKGTKTAVRRGPEMLEGLLERVGGILDAAEEQFVRQVDDFLNAAVESGSLAGLPIDDIKQQVLDAIHHSFDAARNALGEIQSTAPGRRIDVAA
jgi:hypothetical protein